MFETLSGPFAHILVFSIYSFVLASIIMLNRDRAWCKFKTAVFLFICIPIGAELVQYFIPMRQISLEDIAWNLVGVDLGGFAAILFEPIVKQEGKKL